MPKITTEYSQKPGGTAAFDWAAWYGDYDEGVSVAFGSTEAEAIADLLENHPQ